MAGLVTPAGSTPSETPTQLDMSTPVQVVIEGVPQMLPLQEVVNGYATKQKMTQATQEASALREEVGKYKRFFEHMESDPRGTIAQLQKSYGISTPRTPDDGDSPDDDSPESAEVAQLKEALAKLERQTKGLESQLAGQAHRTKLDKDFADAKTKYGDRFDKETISAYMVANNIDNPDTAFRLWSFDQGSAAQPTPAAAADSDIADQALSLSQVMPGSPTNTPPPPDASLEPAKTVFEAARRAYAEQGIDLDAGEG